MLLFVGSDAVFFTVWGYVGHGVSLNVQRWLESAKSSVGTRNGTKVIVSRSHAGDVQKVVQASLGNDAKVESAGGAGQFSPLCIYGTVYVAYKYC